MTVTAQAMRRWLMGATAFVAMSVLTTGLQCVAQAPAAPAMTSQASAPVALSEGVLIDRLVAVVNGDVLLESDIDEERRFEEIQPLRAAADFTREKIIERLVDRELILQQAALQPEDAVSDKELDAQLDTVRKGIAACKQDKCETDEGWKKFLGDHGFSVEEFRSRWRLRMELLKFIVERFQNGVKVSDDQVKTYYEKTMLPEYTKRHVTPPPMEVIKKQIEEVLLQQEVTALLQDWLKSLRAQGSVRIITPGEVVP
jgi:peptidyl-prolyl cis-trans isomerase SurA